MPTVISRQEGSATLTANTTDITISTVTKNQSIAKISLKSSGGGTNLTSHLVTGILTSGTNLRLQRSSSTSNCVVCWQVIEFNSDVTVQTLEVSHSASFSVNTAVSTVNLSRTISFNSCRTSTSPTNGMRDILTRERLTSSTNVRSNCYQSDTNMIIACHVVEFGAEVTVQQFDGTFSTASTDITISSVTTANTWITGNVFPLGTTNVDADQVPGRRLFDSTTVRVSSYTAYDWYDNTYVVSSNDTTVTRGYAAETTITGTETISVEKDASMVNIGGNAGSIVTCNTTSESFADFSFCAEMNSNTLMSWSRESSANTASLPWEVIEFAYDPKATKRRLFLIT